MKFRKFQKKLEVIILGISQRAKRGHGGEPPGAGATSGREPTSGHGWGPPLAPEAHFRLPFDVLVAFDLKMSGGPSKKYSATSAMQKPDREKKGSGREKSTGEMPSQRGDMSPTYL